MKKTIYAAIFTSLLISSLFVSSVVADNVIITIKGGFGCTVNIQNNENHTINATMTVVSQRIFVYGGTNITYKGKIYPGKGVGYRSLVFGIESVYAMACTENQTVIRKGISIFNVVILFR
jgi:hypothetical protein